MNMQRGKQFLATELATVVQREKGLLQSRAKRRKRFLGAWCDIVVSIVCGAPCAWTLQQCPWDAVATNCNVAMPFVALLLFAAAI